MSDMDGYGDAVELAQPVMRDVAPPPAVDKHVCPYCGLAGPRPEGPCVRCTIEDSPQTRQATKARIGPWYVLQSRNPAAPGMKWSTLLALVRKGQVTPRAVVRGPTTNQLWRLGSQVKGLSREFGVCYSCGGRVDRTANQCPHCDRLQEPPANPDQLLESRELPRRPEPAAESQPTSEATALATVGPARPDAGLLTARELAAAFQLQFSGDDDEVAVAPAPSAQRKQERRPAVEVAPVALPAVKTPAPAARKPRRARRALMVLSLLGMAGAAAVIWLNPEYQAKARELVSAGMATVSKQLSSSTGAEPPATAGHDPAASADHNASSVPPTLGQPKPAEDNRHTVQREKSAAPAGNAPAVKLPTDPEEIRQYVRTLRSTAIDAEAAGDDAKAVVQYEQIRKLPREYWPSDLDLRLEAAKARSR